MALQRLPLVNGAPVRPSTLTGSVGSIQTSLVDSTVPLYLIAVAITLGFWGGDIFDRHFGARYKNTSKRRSTR